ncbi:MAG TPA: flagellar filament capping protein FliD [Hyphomicrobiales bacterium]|nr:flagellar filament capping protein FliD [Hyphomicrobiales bacterium]
MITATGMGSGLDINGLVSQLVSAERAGTDLQLSRVGSKLNAKVSALGSLKSAMSSLQGSLASLNNLSSFDKRSATVSDSAALGVAAKAGAVPATYSLEVTQLASAHSLAGPAVAALDAPLGTGTLTFRFGTTDYEAASDSYDGFTLNPAGKTTTLTIDENNNTLSGLMQAINDADFGVSASIVHDGEGYRLLLASKASGAANALEISAADADGDDLDMAGLSRFAFNAGATNATQSKAASDALLSINGVPIKSASNTLSSTIANIELTLKQVTQAPVNVEIKEDSSAVTNALQAFINGYNGFVRSIKTLTAYDPTTNTAGTLIGDFSVRTIVSQVDAILRNEIGGLVGDFRSLADIGLSTDKDGQFVLDSAKFTAALKEAPANVRGLFATTARATDPGVAYGSAGEATQAGDYAVVIDALATAGRLAGGGVLPPDFSATPLVIDTDNRSLSLEVDGVPTGELLLTLGSYASPEELAAEIQARINGAANLVAAGVSVQVSHDAANQRFVIASTSVGDTSTVEIKATGTTSAATLGFAPGEGMPGTNVAGSIGGVAATGQGSTLTGAAGSAAAGLVLDITGNATGNRGTVNFTRGATAQLDALLGKLLGAESSLQTRIDSAKEQQAQLQERKEKMELRWEAVQKRYLAQFNALDTLMSRLNTTSSFLQTQLASLPGAVSNNS